MLRISLTLIAATGLLAAGVRAQPAASNPDGAQAVRIPRPPTPAEYVDRPKARGPTYDLAVEAALEAINHCKADNQDISVQVTDSAGEIVVLISPNAAGMRSLRLLKGKAVTPYMTGKPSSAARDLARTDTVIANRIAGDVAVGYPGSVPIIVGNEMIGAITVSGSQNNTDEVCANAGLSKIRARLK
ncbi:MAG: heme-binding protein [Alphaproteobacteria bacterium]|nr:heme-binding protein [Alphaproteobacteria bacterium]